MSDCVHIQLRAFLIIPLLELYIRIRPKKVACFAPEALALAPYALRLLDLADIPCRRPPGPGLLFVFGAAFGVPGALGFVSVRVLAPCGACLVVLPGCPGVGGFSPFPEVMCYLLSYQLAAKMLNVLGISDLNLLPRLNLTFNLLPRRNSTLNLLP